MPIKKRQVAIQCRSRERDFMPQFGRIAYLGLFCLTTTACSMLPFQKDHSSQAGAGGVFRESSADVVNRAPSSMTPVEPQLSGNEPADHRTLADYHFSLAETYSLQGDPVRASEEYKLTLVYDPKSAPVHLRLASEFVKQSLVSEAVEEVKQAIELDPDFVDAHLFLGTLYSAKRMYEDALKSYRAALSINPDNLEAPLYVGAILAEQKKYGEAAEHFEKLGKNPSNPNSHIAWYYLGRVRLEEEKTDKKKAATRAEIAFEKSLAAKPGYADAVLALGALYENSDRKDGKDRAIKIYKVFQEKYGPSAAVAEELARLHIENKDYLSAYDQLAIIEANDPGDIGVKAKMAFILIEQQRYKEAISRLEDVLALEPNSDKIRFYLGAVFEELKDYKSAISNFVKIPVGSGYYAESVIHSAYLYKLLGSYSEAIETVKKGISNKEDHAPFYALYASLLDDQKQYRKAVIMLSDAVKKFPDHAQLHFFLGNMQDRTGDKEATILSMRRVLELDQDHVQALNFLAYTFADNGRQLEEAEALARRALSLQPDDGYILDTMGWVLFKRGRVSESVRMLEAAYKRQPSEAVIAEHLADAYYKNQMPEKAKKLYLRAAENESDEATVAKIYSKIAAVDKQIQAMGGGDRDPASIAIDVYPPKKLQPQQSAVSEGKKK